MRFQPFSAIAITLALSGSLAACSASSSSSLSSTPIASQIAQATPSAQSGPDASALLNAENDNNNWMLPGKIYYNNRYTGLEQITPQNVHALAKAWSTEIADAGEQESSPIIWQGTMYLGTPHDNVLALDAATGKLKWQFPYNPSYVLLYSVTRGVGIADGKVFIGTQDCRVIAIDAATGKQSWNINGCPNTPYTSTANTWFSIASYPYKGQLITGTAGGDTGSVGHLMAFSVQDGKKLWDWQTIPGPGQPNHNTWPGNSWQHGGGPIWTGLAIDPQSETVFIAPGNPGPDLVDAHRKGRNLYTDSVVAIDISRPQPKMRWYYQMRQNDTHDEDPVQPVLFDGNVGSTMRHLVAVGDKAADLVILDRTNGKLIYRMTVDNQKGLNTAPTLKGELACPNHGGGIEWNAGAYDPGSNLFLVPSTQECAVFKIQTANPTYIPGQPYTGGPLPKRQHATGLITAVDITTGKVAWTHAFPYPGQGGVLVTKTGIAFTSDAGGHLYAFQAKAGNLLWQTDTGASIVAPISAYSVGGTDYIAVLSGAAGNQQTPNMPVAKTSVITAYRLGPVAAPITNTTAGQTVVAGTSASNASLPPSAGSAPYTSAQVAAGQTLYRQQCASCHGAQLQGVSAPAITGASFARSHLNLAQVRTIVTTQMPLSAPGSLKPQQYANIMAYLLSYECVHVAQQGTQPFPTTNEPEFSKVILGGRSCPPKPLGHE
jgi:alcohol dehydrogenase (cytochrome c)